MNIVDTVFTTDQLGAPPNWDEARDGKCLTLPTVRVEERNSYASFWLPSKEDLEKLNAGQPICLEIIGRSHPVVSVHVEHEVKTEHITAVL
jgi:hypothetical protein